MAEFELGERVRFTKPLVRRMRAENPREYHVKWMKVWEPNPHYGKTPEPIREGIVVGVRTLANGHNDYLGYEDGIAFRPHEHFQAVMIVTDLRRVPVYVRPENVERLSPDREETR